PGRASRHPDREPGLRGGDRGGEHRERRHGATIRIPHAHQYACTMLDAPAVGRNCNVVAVTPPDSRDPAAMVCRCTFASSDCRVEVHWNEIRPGFAAVWNSRRSTRPVESVERCAIRQWFAPERCQLSLSNVLV